MRSAVDNNILLDVLTDDRNFGERSRRAIEGALSRGKVVICEQVFAELAAAFDGEGDLLESFLDDAGINLDPCTRESYLMTGRIWRRAGRRKHPRRVLPDFIVGAHAWNQADCLLTRDRGFYRKCFDGIRIVDPSSI